MAATGPTPNFLVPLLVCVPLFVGVALGARVRWLSPAAAGRRPFAGSAVWDSALALPALLGIGAGLLAGGPAAAPAPVRRVRRRVRAGREPAARSRAPSARPRSSPVTAPAAALALGSTGWRTSRARPPACSACRCPWSWTDRSARRCPARSASSLRGRAARGRRLGRLATGGPGRSSVGRGPGGGLRVEPAHGRRRGALPVRPRRCRPLALAGCRPRPRRGCARAPGRPCARRSRSSGPGLAGHRRVVRAWRDPAHAARVWEVPPLDPVRDTLRRAGVRARTPACSSRPG